MKIAVISDIHSNIVALNAVLDSIKSNSCEEIICLGDLVGYGPHPNEVIEKISQLGISTIMGNYDEAVGFYLPYCGCHLDSKVKLLQSQNSLRWTEENTKEENKIILRQLPEQLECNFNGKVISAYHGSPSSITEYIYDNQQDRLQEVIEELNTDILLLGHTHLPFIKWIGNKLIINPGSVGKPKDGDNRASYVLLELNEKVNIEIIRVSYDIDKVIEDMSKTSLLKEFGEMLRLGKIL
ncbi:metallophosphoesterase family protein [Alkaliphilus oremlandii]|uniref:Phosphoesterase n=1 Tax=Alkaliphilus oremlandii (strain OhILAs) TaxID=350688 RepID=A8MGV7_ALKOO|nr:metallophosphoesterase family protein [Alkaliphilus oremlandii]ABW18651.1 phosphodiesterase, MJ0936 family [Alkaliphilus oremlandii OhILAs]